MPEICFSKSPIREVVFEIIFKKDFKWDPTIPGLFFEEIKYKFPNKNSVQEGIVEFQFNPKRKEHIQNFSQNEIPQFLNSDKNIFILIKRNGISFHHQKDYTSWNNYSSLIKYAYQKYVDIVNRAIGFKISNKDIARLELKYINKIEIPKNDFKLEEYFNFRPTLIDKAADLDAFIVGSVYKKNNSALKIQINTAKSDDKILNFILSLDCYTNTVEKEILEWSKEAHRVIEEKFLQALTEKTIKLFN